MKTIIFTLENISNWLSALGDVCIFALVCLRNYQGLVGCWNCLLPPADGAGVPVGGNPLSPVSGRQNTHASSRSFSGDTHQHQHISLSCVWMIRNTCDFWGPSLIGSGVGLRENQLLYADCWVYELLSNWVGGCPQCSCRQHSDDQTQLISCITKVRVGASSSKGWFSLSWNLWLSVGVLKPFGLPHST